MYKVYTYKEYMYKVYTYKVYTYKVYTYKVYTYKVYTYKVYTYKVYTYKVYTHEYPDRQADGQTRCSAVGGRPRARDQHAQGVRTTQHNFPKIDNSHYSNSPHSMTAYKVKKLWLQSMNSSRNFPL